MCGPRQHFFSQCGPEIPKGWTTLLGGVSSRSGLPKSPDHRNPLLVRPTIGTKVDGQDMLGFYLQQSQVIYLPRP